MSVTLQAITAFGLLLLTAFASAAAASERAAPYQPPQVPAVYVDTAPVIDGKLDDACWTQAARLTDFYVLDLDQPVPEETTGLICVDDKAIYVGFICKDKSQDDIVAAETRRNGDISSDDYVEFALDPWNKHDTTYSFRVSARGTQAEDIPGGSATKIEWRGDWTAAVARTPEGWTAEMGIPFSILRCPPGQTTFGFSVRRHLAKERLEICFPNTGRPWNPTLAADLVGLHPPVIRPRPIFMPYVTLDSGGEGRHFDAGLDVQYKLPNGLTALGAVNPDFRHIEDVVEPISFSYTERYLPDPRPFFITGQEGYLPNSHLLYTRRIADFDAGVKLFGTVGNESIGLLDAITFGEENSLAGMWSHRFSDDDAVQIMAVDHAREGEPSNIAYGGGGQHIWRHPEGTDTIWTMFYQSREDEGRSGGWYEIGGEHTRGNGQPWWDWALRAVTRDFQPALGYNVDQDSAGGEFDYGVQTRYEKGSLESRSWVVNSGYLPYRHGGGVLKSYLVPSYAWGWRSGYYLSVGVSQARYYRQDSSDVHMSLGWKTRDMYRQGGLSVLRGVRAGGDYTELYLSQGFRPRRNLSANLGVEYSHLEPPSPDAYHAYQSVLTATYDLTTEKCVSARLIARDGGFNVFATYRQVVRRGMDAYVLLGDPNPEHTGVTSRVILKLIWVF
jgi:hypothetical protein